MSIFNLQIKKIKVLFSIFAFLGVLSILFLSYSDILSQELGTEGVISQGEFARLIIKQLGLERDKLGDNELIDLILKEPRLVRRPVVRIDGNVYFSADRSVLEGLVS